MRIGVTISRDWDDYEAVEDALRRECEACTSSIGRTISFHKVTVVHGASQMDWFIAGVAHALGMEHEPHAADWVNFPRTAGVMRNQEMVDAGADVWLAFIKNKSRGASDCTRRAEAAGIVVIRYER